MLKSVWFKHLNDKEKEVIIEAIERVKEGRSLPLQAATDERSLLDVLLLRRLKPKQCVVKYTLKEREALILYFRDAMKPREIAERLKMPVK